ncbi:hypothetical protein TNCV_4836621 [Trichonephila clavipes]|nr:hypothetical protein TNCV_4836621 [Trichonephila clavipes]
MEFRRQNSNKFPLARNSEIPLQVSQPFISRFTGWTNVHPVPGNSFKDLYLSSTQAMIREKGGNANASCTTIGPPLLKSHPTLQAQVSKIKKFRVPDRGLKAAGTA